MKKTKLLTSVAALALVLSLGACNQPEDDSTSSEETSSETSSTSTEQEKVTLTNYTLSITLKDEAGEPVAIPFYDSVYIQGSWDSWAEWTVLTDIGDETESVLTTTFASIEEGTYEFKGLIGNQDDEVGWKTLTEFIVSSTGGNVSFEVNGEDGDNYTNNLEFTVDASKVPVLEETPMTEEEIITAILAAAEDADDNGLGWVAFHGEALDESIDDLTEAYLTTDANGDPYGYVYEYDTDEEEVLFEYYYVDGNEYFHRLSGDYYSVDEAEDSFEDMLEDYIEGLTPFAYASYGDREDWVLGHEEGSSYYTLTISDTYVETLTVRRAGDNFEIIAVEESTEDVLNGVESTKGELITVADVEAQMGDFNADYWDPLYFGGATDPSELVYRAALTGNYSVEIQYEESYTTETMTYAEYELAMAAYYGQDTSDEAIAALSKYYSVIYGEYVTDYTITIDLYYDTDYIYMEEYVDNSLVEIYICVNAEDGLWEYMYPYNGGWGYISASTNANRYGFYTWEDEYYSLFDAVEDGTADHLEYDEDYEAYDFDDWTYSYYYGYVSEASADWFVDLGGEWLMGQTNAWSYAYAYYLHYYTFFDEDDQDLMSWYEYSYLTYVDRTINTDLCACSEDIYMTVYDVGETDESETVYYYHNALQASINGSN